MTNQERTEILARELFANTSRWRGDWYLALSEDERGMWRDRALTLEQSPAKSNIILTGPRGTDTGWQVLADTDKES